MSSSTLPLDRLNYYNGQRLQAADFRAEQDYHIRVLRWLNKSLYNAGIADGLEVSQTLADPSAPPVQGNQVVVSPGLALDDEGHPIILLAETVVDVIGVPNSDPSWVFGNFLTIEYAEVTAQETEDGCRMQAGGGDSPWGGPSRIRAQPLLSFQGSWPSESEGKIVLCQVELLPDHTVAIHTGVRRYVRPAESGVQPLSLEGEKDIGDIGAADDSKVKTLRFHISGGRPNSLRLYLRGGRFSRHFYSELGRHSHEHTLGTAIEAKELAEHFHNIEWNDDIKIASANEDDDDDPSTHGHYVSARIGNVKQYQLSTQDGGDNPVEDQDLALVNMKVSLGHHDHTLEFPDTTQTTSVSAGAIDHAHDITGGVTMAGAVGVAPARDGETGFTYLNELKVLLDETDITAQILSQARRLPTETLGSGTEDWFTELGVGPIELTRVGLPLDEGEHSLRFEVTGLGNGGKIQWNLYLS